MNESHPKIRPTNERPWTVIVREGIVVGRYRAEDSYATDAEVNHVSLGDGPLEIYEVDARMPLPPPVGEQVSTETIRQWTRMKSGPQEKDCSPQPPTDD